MKSVHLVIPDLLLPRQLAAYAAADLRLPALEKLLARANQAPLKLDTLEAWLCTHFGVDDMAIAPLTLLADGVQPGDSYWLRADPVHLDAQRKQTLLQAEMRLSDEEAAQLCASLNAHFAADGLRFHAPHPQRWYLQLGAAPAIQTCPLPQVVGADVHAHLPVGDDALRWHSLFNEIQMLFYEHAVNQAREQRGEPAVSAVWLWGGGRHAGHLLQPFAAVAGDSELAAAFAQVAEIPAVSGAGQLRTAGEGQLLLVSEGVRRALQRADIASWRAAVQDLENLHVAPLLAALAKGELTQITLDVLNEGASRRCVLRRADLWKFWRYSRPILHYSPRQDTP